MTSLNTQGQADLLLGDSQTLATYLGVTAKTIERWKAGQPMPTAAFKLMQLRYGDLSALGGSGGMVLPWDKIARCICQAGVVALNRPAGVISHRVTSSENSLLSCCWLKPGVI